jgi:hypothetical protein
MILQRTLKALLQAGAEGAELHLLINPWGSRRKFAAFAFIAEQYGYRYDGLAGGVPTGVNHPSFAFRRLPDAAERARRTMAQYPHSPQSGPYPGMRPGGDGLTPLPENRHEVELLHARIKVDLYGESAEKRVRKLHFAIPVAVLLVLLVTRSFTPTAWLVAGCICVGWSLYLWLAMSFMRRRHTRYLRMLEAAGVSLPPNRARA